MSRKYIDGTRMVYFDDQTGNLTIPGNTNTHNINASTATFQIINVSTVNASSITGIQSGIVETSPGLDSYNTNAFLLDSFGESWSPIFSYGTDNWAKRCIALSATGQYIFIAPDSNPTNDAIISHDFGKSFITSATAFLNKPLVVAVAANGQYFIAGTAASPVQIAINSNYGAATNWSNATLTMTGTCAAVAVSENGKYMAAVSPSAQIEVSRDYGSNWTLVGSSENYTSIAISGTGQFMTASVMSGNIYKSSDYGSNWTAVATSDAWSDVAVSYDGSIQIASADNGDIYKSSNYGSNWASVLTPGTPSAWAAVSLAGNGLLMLAAQDTDFLWRTNDGGASWTSQDSLNHQCIATSLNGAFSIRGIFGNNLEFNALNQITPNILNFAPNDGVRIGYAAGMSNQYSNAIAIGFLAGNALQQSAAIAIGDKAGQLQQNARAIAIGSNAGFSLQGTGAIAIGENAGSSDQNGGIAIGINAGSNQQRSFAIAIGESAGGELQQSNAIAMGRFAGLNNQSNSAIAIGDNTALNNQGEFAIAIGSFTATCNQGSNAIAIGSYAGVDFQSNSAIAIGFNAGSNMQGEQSVAIGERAGQTNQLSKAIAVGFRAAETDQGENSIAIGNRSGLTTQNAFAVAIGDNAGRTNQSTSAIAIGSSAGLQNQEDIAISIGADSGHNNQKTGAIAIGYSAGYDYQGSNSISIGTYAGLSSQLDGAIAVGGGAGSNAQGTVSIAIGSNAGFTLQGAGSIAIGSGAGSNTQGSVTIAIGSNAGSTSQSAGGVAIGVIAGSNAQGAAAVAIGSNAGFTSQGAAGIAIGTSAGSNTQGTIAIAIGSNAGTSNQGTAGVSIGVFAGMFNQGSSAISLGSNAGSSNQATNSIAIGSSAGKNNQGSASVAIGINAGVNSQGSNSIAIGQNAGLTNQNIRSIAIGTTAGATHQSTYAIAIGYNAGSTRQRSNAIAIGNSAGYDTQGIYAIAIGFGAGQTNQNPSSIIINAGSVALNNTTVSGLFINPIRNNDTVFSSILQYNSTSKEVTYTNVISIQSTTAIAGRFHILNASTIGGFSPVTFTDTVIFNSTVVMNTPSINTNVSSLRINTSSIAVGVANAAFPVDVTGSIRATQSSIGAALYATNAITAASNIITSRSSIANAVYSSKLTVESGNPQVFIRTTGAAMPSEIMYGGFDNTINAFGYDCNSGRGMFAFVNGADRLRINSTGMVGIGTNYNPSFLLDVNGTGSFVSLSSQTVQITGTGNAIRLSNTTSNGSIYSEYSNTGSNGTGRFITGIDGSGLANIVQGAGIVATWCNSPLIFLTNQSEKLRILATGEIGIGTTTPAYTLDTNGSIRATQSIIARNADILSNTNISTLLVYNSITTSSLTVTNRGSDQVILGNTLIQSASGNYGFRFTADATASVSYIQAQSNIHFTSIGFADATMFVGTQGTYDGRVGIGTTTPAYTLDVNGLVNISSAITIAGSNPGDMLSKRYNVGDRFGIGQYSGGIMRIFGANAASGNVRISFATNDDTSGSSTGFNDRLTVLLTGQVGIGCNSPAFLLDVNGSAHKSNNSTAWDTTSDRKIKDNIQFADLTICLSTINALPLMRYSYLSTIFPNRYDNNVLGFIAQDVQTVIPKAVYSTSAYGFSTLLNLDYDQIYKAHIGATQHLSRLVAAQQSTIEAQQQILYIQQSTLASLVNLIGK